MFRAIDSKFWTDSTVKSLSIEDRYLMLYLITNPHSHSSGLYFISLPTIAHETKLKSARKGIDRLSIANMVRYDYEADQVWIVKMAQYQCKNEKHWKGVENYIKTLHKTRLLKEFVQFYANLEYPIDTLSDLPDTLSPVSVSIDTDIDTSTDTNIETDTEVKSLVEYYIQVMHKQSYKLDSKRKKRIREVLKDFLLDDCKRMVDACRADKFHMGENDRQTVYNDLCKHIFKDQAKMEAWLEGKPKTEGSYNDW